MKIVNDDFYKPEIYIPIIIGFSIWFILWIIFELLNTKKTYLFRKCYWECLINTRWCQFTGVVEWRYSWWKSRLEYIKNGEIS